MLVTIFWLSIASLSGVAGIATVIISIIEEGKSDK